MLAREMKLLKLGNIALDGTKIHANASRHKALSWAHANKIEAQLCQEVKTLLALAEKSDRSATPDGMDVPAEIARREDRLSAIAQAKAKIEQRAAERYKAQQQERDAHHEPLMERFAADAPEPRDANAVQQMMYRLGTQSGRALYSLRKQTVEPVFGIIKRVMGWRQMSMRGLDKAQGEWSLVTMVWNIKRMHVLRGI